MLFAVFSLMPWLHTILIFNFFVTEHGFFKTVDTVGPMKVSSNTICNPCFLYVRNNPLNAAFSYNSVDHRPDEFYSFDAWLIFISRAIFCIHLKSVDLIVQCVFYWLHTWSGTKQRVWKSLIIITHCNVARIVQSVGWLVCVLDSPEIVLWFPGGARNVSLLSPATF
jgi:hypothetical protein